MCDLKCTEARWDAAYSSGVKGIYLWNCYIEQRDIPTGLYKKNSHIGDFELSDDTTDIENNILWVYLAFDVSG